MKKDLLKAHILSVLMLPFNFIVVMSLIILIIENNLSITENRFLLLFSLLLIFFGIIILAITVSLFFKIGEGTIAPWNPNTELIQVGPYRYSRNPMIIAVLITLLGIAVLFESSFMLGYVALFFVINHIYFVFIEEPGLYKRFGEDYEKYKKEVGRWFKY